MSAACKALLSWKTKVGFTDEDTTHFFSFLCECGYLSAEEVTTLLRQGLAPRRAPIQKRFALRETAAYPKKIAYCLLYWFWSHYTGGDRKTKRTFLLFLGGYLEEFKAAGDPTAYKGLSSNLTGEVPASLGWEDLDRLVTYLPVRFHSPGLSKP